MNCRVRSLTVDSAVDIDASTSTEVGNLPPPIDILWHPVGSFYDSADHGRHILVIKATPTLVGEAFIFYL